MINRLSILAVAVVTLAACGSDGEMGAMGAMGLPGTDGANGTNGTNGSNGTSGQDGISCWDLNENHTCDVASEDVDGDAACTAADCLGAEGPQGPPGTGTAGQAATTVFGSAALTLSPTAPVTLIPGLTQTINVPAGVAVQISTDGGVQTTSTTATGLSVADIVLYMDGSAFPNGGYQRIVAASTTGLNPMIAYWRTSLTTTVAAGTHTFEVRALGANIGLDARVSGDNGSVLQGQLSILLLKL